MDVGRRRCANLEILYHKSWTAFGRDYEPFAPAAYCNHAGQERRLG